MSYVDSYIALYEHKLGKALLSLANITPDDLVHLLTICDLYDGISYGDVEHKTITNIAKLLNIKYDSEVLTEYEYYSASISSLLKESTDKELYSICSSLLKYLKSN